MYCLETVNLSHQFSKNDRVLDHINLRVPYASIYGFLGPNGAGKTTTLRLVLGLLKKQAGEIAVFGKSFSRNRLAILSEVGSLIESPSLYGHLTATENLRLLQKIYGCPSARIPMVLEQVGLGGTGSKKARRFSLGMKQRLAIAVALLNNPSLLILDEPTNGLDPNGIIEIRELLKKLNREHGITIILSSHLLPEIEKLVTHTGIINKGKMMFQGSFPELVSRKLHGAYFAIQTNDPEKAKRVIQDQLSSVSVENDRIIIPAMEKEAVAQVNRKLVEAGLDVYGIENHGDDFEAIFMKLINN